MVRAQLIKIFTQKQIFSHVAEYHRVTGGNSQASEQSILVLVANLRFSTAMSEWLLKQICSPYCVGLVDIGLWFAEWDRKLKA